MKHSFKQNGGFTLVELIVAIAVATIVTAAATTVLMLALRVNRQTGDTASQLITVRSLLTAMEKAAAEGNIKKVTADFDSWELIGDSEDKKIFSYDAAEQTISSNGVVILTGVYASSATYSENGLLTISIEIAGGTYSSSIFCRTGLSSGGETVEEGTIPTIPGDSTTESDSLQPGTLEYFISVLKSQYGSKGEILVNNLDGVMENSGVYYSEWYIGLDYDDLVDDAGWNPKTPWCACFVSWALEQAGMDDELDRKDANGRPIKWFAEVDDFMAYFNPEQESDTWSEAPSVGAIVFFDWNKDGDPQHVGVVLGVEKDVEDVDNDGDKDELITIYTIEGNSAGRVMIRCYPIDSQYILGYGVLPWAS